MCVRVLVETQDAALLGSLLCVQGYVALLDLCGLRSVADMPHAHIHQVFFLLIVVHVSESITLCDIMFLSSVLMCPWRFLLPRSYSSKQEATAGRQQPNFNRLGRPPVSPVS
jgi:hypothetical protein